jgi:uncharacterized protein YfaS (alpha-2-macroglobulin family)
MNKRRFSLFLGILLTASLSCTLPSAFQPQGQEAETPTSALDTSSIALSPLPPSLVEIHPTSGEELPLQDPIFLYFDQPMDQASVVTSLEIQPKMQAELSWLDDATLRIQPTEILPVATTYTITINTEAMSTIGLAVSEPIRQNLTTVGYLELTQVIPEPDDKEVNPSAPITLVFNRPVVPLQVDDDHPNPLSFNPPVAGDGEWIDTSIYIFRPETAFPGGVSITAELDPALTSLNGAPLAEPFQWSFTSANPKLISIVPSAAELIPLDSSFVLTFNQPMDERSVENAFTLTSSEFETLDGDFQWNEASNELTFTPNARLAYASTYDLVLDSEAHARGGEKLLQKTEMDFDTVPVPSVISTSLGSSGLKPVYGGLEITFNAPMDETSILEALELTPSLENKWLYWREDINTVFVYGDYQPATTYQLNLSTSAADPYGTGLSQAFSLNFTTTDLPPQVSFPRFGEILTLASDAPQVVDIQVRNAARIDLQLYRLTLDEALSALTAPYANVSESSGELLRQWSQPVSAPRNQTYRQPVRLQSTPLSTGLYQLIIDIPNDQVDPQRRLLLIRHVEIVVKSSTAEAFIWAVDLNEGVPLSAFPIRLLDEFGTEVGEGLTDAEGVLTLPINLSEDPYARLYAVSSEPGDSQFGMTANTWSDSLHPYTFGISHTLYQPPFKTYLYTDRPIYRPGQTVRFRGVLRQTDEARYTLPDQTSVDITVREAMGDVIHSQIAQLSSFGTFDGEFSLNDEATLGVYLIETEYGSVYFDVAAYRKPEFTVVVNPSAEEIAVGEPLTAEIAGEYFFGGPVSNASVQWTAWATPFYTPDFPQAIDWFSRASIPGIFPGGSLAQGSGQTGEDGSLLITLPTDLEDTAPAIINIEATLIDNTGLPVTGRATVKLHPASVYLSLIPQRYALRENEEAVVKLNAVDWTGEPAPNQSADILVERVSWTQVVDENSRITWTSEATPVNRATRATDNVGAFLFSFQPERAGTYRVSATGEDSQGRQTIAELTIWVAGHGVNVWRSPHVGRIALVPDRAEYQHGDTARVFIPSPYGGDTTALVTIERGEVLTHQVISLSATGTLLEIPIEPGYAPNIYLSVAVIQPHSDTTTASIAVGMVELTVDPEALALQVTLTPDRSRAGPGEQITYTLRATDSQGNPVEAAFSLALTDLAALSLADPNSPSPFEAFYGDQPLRVRTGASLVMSGESVVETPGPDGIGGGGDGLELIEVREEFPDTAYWNATVVTDSQGRSEITLTLPDSLTTWHMDARGVSLDTLVGDATVDIVATKDLLIRPVTPRFFTAGDVATVAAVVHNNTGRDLAVEASLLASGVEITSSPSSSASVATNGQVRFEWDINVLDVEAVDLTFRASGGGYSDASKPTIGSALDGALPVLRHSAPEIGATAGTLTEAGTRTEAINLPRSYDATQGELRTTLDPTLGAAINSALDALETTPDLSTESAVSRFLPNVVAYQALIQSGIDDPTFQARLEQTLQEGLQVLQSRQNADGGWGWWRESPSDTYLTAYVLHGLSLASRAGATISEQAYDGAIQYLLAGLVSPDMLSDSSSKDRQAFILYVLTVADHGDLALARQMADDRTSLSLWARAFITQTLGILAPDDDAIPELLSDFQAAAIQSSTGIHWEESAVDRRNFGSPVTTTSHVLQAWAMLDPDHARLPNVVRWLAAARSRDGSWASTHETTWALLALTEWAKQSGSFEANYTYSMVLNNRTLASGAATDDAPLNAIEQTTPIAELFADQANQLSIGRGGGEGALYYTAHLSVYRPIEDVDARSHGLTVLREYFHYDGECGGVENPCAAATSANVGEDLLVRLTLILPSDQYYLTVEDPYPAGAEPVDTQLLTTPSGGPPVDFSSVDLGRIGWGGWWFRRAQFGDDRLRLFAEFMPAGSYQYTYLLHATLPGEYRVLPPRAWAVYFPEVYGQGEGRVYTIKP